MRNIKRIIAYSIIVLYIAIIGIVSNTASNVTNNNVVILSFITLLSYLLLRFLSDKMKHFAFKNKEMFIYKACAVSFIVFVIVCGILCLIEFNTRELYIPVLSFIMPSTSASMALSFVYALIHLLITSIENIGSSNRL